MVKKSRPSFGAACATLSVGLCLAVLVEQGHQLACDNVRPRSFDITTMQHTNQFAVFKEEKGRRRRRHVCEKFACARGSFLVLSRKYGHQPIRTTVVL